MSKGQVDTRTSRPEMYSLVKAKRRRYKAQGLCIDCSSVTKDTLRCSNCLRVSRRSQIKFRYRLTLETYERILQSPCNICGTTRKRRVLDHNHATKQVRGALCNYCNSNLGWFEKHEASVRKHLSATAPFE